MNDTARTEEHAAARHKRITGSRIGKIMTGGPAAWDTLSDMLHSPEPEVFYTLENTPDMPEQMRRGLEFEPMARSDFFFRHDEYDIEQPMFCVPGDDVDEDLREWIGVSPDAILTSGVLNVRAGLELKVPSMEKHLEWAKAGIVPAEHLPQCFLSLLVTGADHWWFCSFCPEIEGDERFFEVKLEREDLYLAHMKKKIREFLYGHIAHKTFAEPAPVQEAIPATSFPVVKFGIEDKAIDVLIERYGTMAAPTTSPEYAVVKAANIDLVKRRTGIKKVYDKSTEEAKEYIAGIRTEKNRLTGRLADVEAHTKQLRTDWEEEQQRKKDELEAKEAARITAIREAIDWMNGGAIDGLNGLTSEMINAQIETFQGTEITEDQYQEFLTEAQNAKTALISKAMEYRGKIFGQEQEAIRVETEQRELRERNELLEAEKLEREKQELKLKKENEKLANELAEMKAQKEIEKVQQELADELDAADGGPVAVGDGVTDDTEAIRAGAPIHASDSKIDFDEVEKQEVSKYPATALFEQLSAIQHDLIWCHWQRYVHGLISKTRAIPKKNYDQWERQINTPYAELSEGEKDSDREQVAKFWYLITNIEGHEEQS